MRRLRASDLVCVALLGAGLIAGCKAKKPADQTTTTTQTPAEGPDSLVGEYGFARGGKVEPVIKITHAGEGAPYDAEEWSRPGQWRPIKAQGHPLTSAERGKLFGGRTDVPFPALGFGQSILIKVPANMHQGALQTQTGYLLLTALGPQELTRM